MSKKIGEFKLYDHGIDGSQYFQGHGVSCTPYTDCATGCGDNPAEAIDDMLEMIGQTGEFDLDGLEERIKLDLGVESFPETPSAYEDYEEANKYEEEEPKREDYETDDEFDTAHEEWEEAKEKHEEEVSGECEMHYYFSISWKEAEGEWRVMDGDKEVRRGFYTEDEAWTWLEGKPESYGVEQCVQY